MDPKQMPLITTVVVKKNTGAYLFVFINETTGDVK